MLNIYTSDRVPNYDTVIEGRASFSVMVEPRY